MAARLIAAISTKCSSLHNLLFVPVGREICQNLRKGILEAFIVKNIISVTILYKINNKFKKVQRWALRVSKSHPMFRTTVDVIISYTSESDLETVGIMLIFFK